MSLARGPSIDTQAHTAFPLRGFFKGLKSICVGKSAHNSPCAILSRMGYPEWCHFAPNGCCEWCHFFQNLSRMIVPNDQSHSLQIGKISLNQQFYIENDAFGNFLHRMTLVIRDSHSLQKHAKSVVFNRKMVDLETFSKVAANGNGPSSPG